MNTNDPKLAPAARRAALHLVEGFVTSVAVTTGVLAVLLVLLLSA